MLLRLLLSNSFFLNEDTFAIFQLCGTVADSADLWKTFVFII